MTEALAKEIFTCQSCGKYACYGTDWDGRGKHGTWFCAEHVTERWIAIGEKVEGKT